VSIFCRWPLGLQTNLRFPKLHDLPSKATVRVILRCCHRIQSLSIRGTMPDALFSAHHYWTNSIYSTPTRVMGDLGQLLRLNEPCQLILEHYNVTTGSIIDLNITRVSSASLAHSSHLFFPPDRFRKLSLNGLSLATLVEFADDVGHILHELVILASPSWSDNTILRESDAFRAALTKFSRLERLTLGGFCLPDSIVILSLPNCLRHLRYIFLHSTGGDVTPERRCKEAFVLWAAYVPRPDWLPHLETLSFRIPKCVRDSEMEAMAALCRQKGIAVDFYAT
jgi:hypothetical protein